MGRWTRDELEDAFAEFQRVALKAGTSGDWNPWADLFTEDATYIESNYGRMGGREAIRKWIVNTMTTPPIDQMTFFPIEWYMIDEARGWITCHVWNRMADPGDGSIHQAYNFTLLKYAGDGLWSYEEDIYDPKHFAEMLTGWFHAKKALSSGG
jgi:hypothetical protein